MAKKVLLLVPRATPALTDALLQRLTARGYKSPDDYRILPLDHDFSNDKAFPDPTINCVALAPVSPVQHVVDSLLLQFVPNVDWVASLWTGVDSVLSDYLRQRSDVTLTNAKHAFRESLGEYAMCAALYFAKQVPRCLEQQRERRWQKYNVAMLQGKTCTIVGMGSIGEAVGRRAKQGFGMRVVGVRRNPAKMPPGPQPYVDEVASIDDLPTLLPASDYVVSILPGTRDNTHFWGAQRLSLMPPHCVFVNIGRGSTVDEEALCDALESDRLHGAALDVFEREPLAPTSRLWGLGESRVLLTPHCADNTDDYWSNAAEIFVKNLDDYCAGRPFDNTVDKELGY